MSLFIIFLGARLGPFFIVFLRPATASPWARLRPRHRPRNLLIKFWTDSVTCLDTISPAITSGAFSDIGKDFATGTQRLEPHCFGSAPQEWADPTEETAEKITDPASWLKVEPGGVDGTDLLSS